MLASEQSLVGHQLPPPGFRLAVMPCQGLAQDLMQWLTHRLPMTDLAELVVQLKEFPAFSNL